MSEKHLQETFFYNNRGLISKYQVAYLEVPGRHEPLALYLDLLEHDGDAVLLVPGPVCPLALLAAVGGSVT